MYWIERSMSVHNSLNGFPSALREHVERAWQAFTEAAKAAKVKPPQHPELLAVLFRVWAYSDFVARTCVRQPEMFAALLESGDLLRDYSGDEYSRTVQTALVQAKNEDVLCRNLRTLRQREMLRIAWRDLAGWADLDETLGDLSSLASACLDGALGWLYRNQCQVLGVPRNARGEAQALVVIGMGKLGAAELNFSSDIDLVFAYPEDGRTQGRHRQISNEEFFVKLAQALVHALDTITSDGFVFRVDMRLRPFGESGPLALSFAAMEDYYQTHGREWERYALIKANIVAGDRAQGERLLASLQPFVFRRYLDFNALAALREMKAMIAHEIERKGMADNIKLGEGGIREIEFIGQLFQLIRGGHDVRLQERGILRVLDTLSNAHYLPPELTHALSASYVFLRRVENRLQALRDEQTHSLPEKELERLRLALAMGYPAWAAFEQALNVHRKCVHSHFLQVFAAPQTQDVSATVALGKLWRNEGDKTSACALLGALGFTVPEDTLSLLVQLRKERSYDALSERGHKLMDQLMPLLIVEAGQTENPGVALARLVHIVEIIAQRTTYLALLIENAQARSQLVKLCAASPWISVLLGRHPLLLDELLDPRTLYAPLDKVALENELRTTLARIPETDLEQLMESLRRFKHAQVLRVAAADTADVLPLMIVSDHLTAIAEVILQQVLEHAWRELVSRHGRPQYVVDARVCYSSFAMVAYGKLGGIELGYGSDLDIVFLHDSVGEDSVTSGPKVVENAVFFARLGQRIIHILNTLTPAGVLYEVDMRLRPSGASGLLVSSLESFSEYQRTQAWTWEHQALVRARIVATAGAGQNALAGLEEEFGLLRREVLGRVRERTGLQVEVRTMRERMREALVEQSPGSFDLKQGRGGIVDIEFMVQYSVLLWAHAHPELLDFPDNIRLLERLAGAGLLAARDVQCLSDAYRAYRTALHRCALQEAPANVPEDEFSEHRAEVIRLWHALMENE
jgi:glutamate-ammonia-ligase adenylyltransferase